MKNRFWLVLVMASAITLPVWAVTVWFSSAPSSAVNSGVSYTVAATASMPGGTGTVTMYKNSGFVASNAGSTEFSVNYPTSDTGHQVVEYHAVAYDSVNGGATADAWAYVTVNAANSAPTGWFDFASSSVPVNGLLTVTGWAVDNEMGAPVARVDILIDGNDVADAELRGHRLDVANALGRPDYLYSGWTKSVNIGALSVGNHTVAISVVDDQGATASLGSTTFAVTNNTPSITLLSPSAQTIGNQVALSLSSNATDPNGNITSHELEIQRPDGTWNYQGGFASGEPYRGGPVGSPSNSTRTASFTFDQVGTWYVRARVEDSSGNSAQSATVAIVVEANTPPEGWLDSATSSVPVYGSLTVAGWAADNEMGAPVTRVDVLIDGVDVADAGLGGYRQDVANVSGRSDYLYSGFSKTVSVGNLSVGSHTVSVRAVDNKGATTTLGSASFTVTLNDTDNDGLPDGWEVAYGRNPNVADSNVATPNAGTSGLTYLLEYRLGTAPTKTKELNGSNAPVLSVHRPAKP